MKSVIEWVNEIREDHGGCPVEKFERGFHGTPIACPISNTIKKNLNVKVYTTRGYVTVISDELIHTSYPTTKEVERFIESFDNHQSHQELAREG